MSDFVLNPRIEVDTVLVADLALSTVRLSTNANHPWLILVPRRAGMVEIIDLEPGDRAILLEEIVRASEVLKRLTRCDKLNIAALGNQVSQLHVHVIARFRDDIAWPDPVWGKAPATPYDAAALAARVAALQSEFGQ